MSVVNDQQHSEIAELLPDFAIGALSDGDLWRVEAHLDTCRRCQDEFAQLLDLVSTMSPPVVPSASAKRQLFETAGLPLSPPARLAPVPSPPSRKLVRFPVRPMQIGLIAAVLAIIVVGAWSLRLQQDLNQDESIFALIDDPAAAHPLTDTEVATTASATLYTDPARTEALLVAKGLPQPETDEEYQIWLFTQTGERIDGGTFTPDADGSTQTIVTASEPFSTYWAVGISAEANPESGSPTTPLILGGWIQ